MAQSFVLAFHLGVEASSLRVLPKHRGEPLLHVNNCQSSSTRCQMGTFCFLWNNHLTAIFASFIGLEDFTEHIEALTVFTQQALNESQQSLSLLNTKII